MVAKPRSPVQTRLTVADYDRLPDDGPRYELINGELIEMPAPTTLHQRLLMRFVRSLDRLVEEENAGEVFVSPFDVELLNSAIVQPDVLFVSRTRSQIVTEKRVVGAPDLVVEISSPSTADHDLGDKRELYRASGVLEYWFIDTEARSATVWILDGDQYIALRPEADGLLWSTVIDGFTVDMERLFTDADRQR